MTFPAKSTIFQPGDLSGELYMLADGKVKTEVFAGNGKWLVLNLVTPGSFFGLKGLLGQPVRREFARTLRSRAKVLVFKNADLRSLMEANFCFSQQILALATAQTLQYEKRTVAQFTVPAPARMAAFLLAVVQQFGKQNGREWYYDSQLTQEEIGAFIGTGRQTVTEILTELKAKRILTYNWGKIWVHDLEKLRKMQL